jgi:hypothetical protein
MRSMRRSRRVCEIDRGLSAFRASGVHHRRRRAGMSLWHSKTAMASLFARKYRQRFPLD